MMVSVRPPAVSGMFYPGNKQEISDFFAECENFSLIKHTHSNPIPRALILPHAGYIYSGCAAYEGYQYWQAASEKIKTVVVIGPAHRVAFEGIATVGVELLETPLGLVEVDGDLRDYMIKEGLISVADQAHAAEHSIEVHLPFIQSMLPNAKILPLLDGMVSADKVKKIIESLWNDSGVYFVISSDLSHFHSYDEAKAIDKQTANLIESGDWQALNGNRACGYIGIQGLLKMQVSHSLKLEQIRLINSGDTAGDKQRVVGYGSWAVFEQEVN
ncbi:MAG: AmmeMemoRadiSam system protein B [Pseudomonadota bacterium]|nr:AmmeMemoRadiSam system protein B [Pseudomonadota bacterium]